MQGYVKIQPLPYSGSGCSYDQSHSLYEKSKGNLRLESVGNACREIETGTVLDHLLGLTENSQAVSDGELNTTSKTKGNDSI